MIRAWLAPERAPVDLTEGLASRVSALHAAARAGFRLLLLPTDSPLESARWIIASFHSPLAVVPIPPALPTPELERRMAQLPQGQAVFTRDLPPGAGEGSPPARKPLASSWAVIFTSGSSGAPKGISLTGAALEASANAQAIHNGSAGCSWLLNLPIHHIGGFSVLSRAFFLGGSVALAAPRFSAEETSLWIQSGLVQGLSLVPTTLVRLLAVPGLSFNPLQLILLGGAPASPALVGEARARGAPIRLTYGMTEHASQIATERAPGTGLEPLPGVELRLSGEGEVLVRSPMLSEGLLSRGTLRPLPSEEGFFPTGDLGKLEGGRLVIEGRKSDLIISGGAKLFPGEVENEIARLPGVRECAVGALPDPEWGEVLCAAIVENAPGAFLETEARSLLAEKIERRKIPKHWVVTPALPRSESGKLVRAELHALLSASVRQA